MKKYEIKIEALSPLHLGGGKADVIVDAEVVHDEFGMPYFPAKRLKGMLYESALELAEISNEAWFTIEQLKKLFGQADDGEACFRLENLYLPDYEKLRKGWNYLNANYGGLFTAKDVLETYTELRYQTKIDKNTGTADEGSLRNMRMVDAGTVFVGNLELNDVNALKILQMAFKNLRFVGAKRNRGCGNVRCTMTERS